MALGLGLAFRERPAERAVVGIERGSVAERYAAVLDRSPEVDLKTFSADSAELAIRKGNVAVMVTGRDVLIYRYDPACTKSRSAQLTADRIVQRAAGAADRVPSILDRERRPGGRYIASVLPARRDEPYVDGDVGMGFGLVRMRREKADIAKVHDELPDRMNDGTPSAQARPLASSPAILQAPRASRPQQ